MDKKIAQEVLFRYQEKDSVKLSISFCQRPLYIEIVEETVAMNDR